MIYKLLKNGNIICQHDWRKMGFEVVKESNADSDGLMDLEKMPKFFKDLHKEIDQFGAKGRAGYGDGVITAVELKLALQNHRLRDRWSKLIAKHPSEWRKDNTSIVEAMKGLLTGVKRTINTWRNKGEVKKNKELGNKVLEHEKERIKELSFWEDVSELGSPSVYHFHPIAFVGNLRKDLINVEAFIREYIKKHSSFDAERANSIPNNATINNLREVLIGFNEHYKNNTRLDSNMYRIAYMLATARHEAHNPRAAIRFGIIDEIGGGAQYEGRGDLGNTQPGDGEKFRGRGLVQLTGRYNYTTFFQKLGVDFVSNPDLVAEYEYAIPILIDGSEQGVFRRNSLSVYINNNEINFFGAREVINGDKTRFTQGYSMNNGNLIKSYAEIFVDILRKTSSASEGFK